MTRQVDIVRYPGLASFPQKELADAQHLNGVHGSMLWFEVKGGTKAGRKLMDTVQVSCFCPCLGEYCAVQQKKSSSKRCREKPTTSFIFSLSKFGGSVLYRSICRTGIDSCLHACRFCSLGEQCRKGRPGVQRHQFVFAMVELIMQLYCGAIDRDFTSFGTQKCREGSQPSRQLVVGVSFSSSSQWR